MKIIRSIIAIAAPLTLLAVGGCAETFNARVARFQRLPVPQGQSFAIVPANAQNDGGIEFGSYAALVAQHLARQGYAPAAPGAPAQMTVRVGYGVGPGEQKVTTSPGFNCGLGGFGGFGYGGFGGRRFGGGYGYGFGGPWAYGWGGPYGGFGGWGCPDVESYTIYQSYLSMDIVRSDGTKLFEGRARAHSTSDSLPKVVPNLIDAMFTGFPGNSGQDIRITIKPDQIRQNAQRPLPPPTTGTPPAGATS